MAGATIFSWLLESKLQASVARCLPTPPTLANASGLNYRFAGAASRSDSHRSTIVVGNCAVWTDIGGSQPSESCHLYAFVDPISAPYSEPGCPVGLVEPPGTAPGSDPFIACAFIAIVPFGTVPIWV